MAFIDRRALFFIYLLFTCSFAEDHHIPEEDVGNANNFIDEVLQNLRANATMVRQIDPLKIPDYNDNGIQVSNIVIKGLSSLYRSGDCSIAYDQTIATIIGHIGVKNVHLSTNYAKKVLFFWISGVVEGSVDHLAIEVKLQVQDGKAKLSYLRVANLGEYRIKHMTGLSVVLNWLLRLIVNSVAQKSRGKIVDALESEVPKALNELLSKIQIPF